MARKRKPPETPDERGAERTQHAANELNIPRAPEEERQAPIDEASKEKNRRETGPPAELDE